MENDNICCPKNVKNRIPLFLSKFGNVELLTNFLNSYSFSDNSVLYLNEIIILSESSEEQTKL